MPFAGCGGAESVVGCLLARRPVEAGSRFVEVDLGGWDRHTEYHTGVARSCDTLDQGLSALLTDLSAKGTLERTLIVLTSEFGRTPRIDQYGGRGHNPFGFTSLMMGGGVTGGAVYGKTKQMETAPGGQLFSLAGKDTAPTLGKPVAAFF